MYWLCAVVFLSFPRDWCAFGFVVAGEFAHGRRDPPPLILRRRLNVHSRLYAVDCNPDIVDSALDARPRRGQRDDDRQLPANEALLMTKILICCS